MAGSLPFRLRSFFLKAQSDFQPGAQEDASSQLAAQLEGAGLVGSNDSSESEDWEELHRQEHYRFKFRWRSFLSHVGPGFLVCIAFIDPGNLEADLQTGATTDYGLLWVLLWATCMGYLLQSLASRLGVVTGKHLAQHCREQYPGVARYLLWVAAELAIIGADVQEVIGTAIALSLLTRGAVPLWAGVVLAAVSAYVLLLLERLGARWLEVCFQLLVAVMAVSMGFIFFAVDIPYSSVAVGLLVPRLSRGMAPVACGMLGATIMPMNLLLHSALVHSRPVEHAASSAGLPAQRPADADADADACQPAGAPDGQPLVLERALSSRTSAARRRDSIRYYDIEAGLALVVTLFINTSVVAVFAHGFFGQEGAGDIGLENAGQYLGTAFGKHMELIWAVGLLAAGQSSTMTGTYSGQFAMSGFLALQISPLKRALLTRGVAILPALAVAVAFQADPTALDVLNQGLNVLQSVQLPFVIIPLLVLTSSSAVMGRRFATAAPRAAAAWAVAALIMGMNGLTAYEAAAARLPRSAAAALACGLAAACYLGFLAYLAVVPRLRWRGGRAARKRGAPAAAADPACEPLLRGG